ncbi:hypothetical protein M0812_04816 [Anaeramoeba flamelloides]|uniref:Uncharacterized protein n=1 Tax=Anaeramoeba flamelloides TaxID=1746091 RepID=A0AAV8AHN8_9EUKA|nr:hypothetical protein M0812_04816 [Anaeramoeba flamelloides]
MSKKIRTLKCCFNQAIILGKKRQCLTNFYKCDLISSNLYKKCKEMNIELRTNLICKKHFTLLKNLYRKELYSNFKQEELQTEKNLEKTQNNTFFLTTTQEDESSFNVGGIELDSLDNTPTNEPDIFNISSDSDSETEPKSFQLVPESIKTQNEFNFYARNRINHSKKSYWRELTKQLDLEIVSDDDDDDDSDYTEDLSDLNILKKIPENEYIQSNTVTNKRLSKKSLKNINVPNNLEELQFQLNYLKENITDFNFDLSQFNVFCPTEKKCSNDPKIISFLNQPRLKYKEFLQNQTLQKDLFKWKIQSNTPGIHFKRLLKILQHYHNEDNLLCTPRVIRKHMLQDIGYDNIYEYYNVKTNNTEPTKERVNTIKLHWDSKPDDNNKPLEHEIEVPYITITTWLDLILQSKLKDYLLTKEILDSNSDVNGPNFQPMEFYNTKKFKKYNINPIDNQYDYMFFISLFIDSQAHKSSMRDNIKGIYMFIENFNVGARLKNHSIFLLMNLPKEVPIYDLKTRLPFISELLQLEKTNTLFGFKVFIKLCSIIGDTLEQQPAAGKTSHSSVQVCRHCSISKYEKSFNLGRNIIIQKNDSNIKTSLKENLDCIRNSNRKRKENLNILNNDKTEEFQSIQINKKKRVNKIDLNFELIQKRIEIEFELSDDTDNIENGEYIPLNTNIVFENPLNNISQDNIKNNTEVLNSLYLTDIDFSTKKEIMCF